MTSCRRGGFQVLLFSSAVVLGACGGSSSDGKPGGQGGGGVGGSTALGGGSGGSTRDAGGADVAATSDTATALDSNSLEGGGGTVPQQCLTGLVNPFAAMAPDWANWSSSSCSSLAAADGSLVLTQNEPCSAASPNAIAGLAPPNVLCGDFDVQVDFAVTGLVAGVTGGIFASVRANDPTVTTNGMTIERYAAEYVVPSSQSYQNYKSYTTNKGDDATSVFVPTTDVTGRFRLTRTGTTVKSYYWKTGAPAGQWVLVNTATLTNTPWVLVLYEGDNSAANKGPTAPYSVTFSNLLVTFPGATDAGTIGQDAPIALDTAQIDSGFPVACLGNVSIDFAALAPYWVDVSTACGAASFASNALDLTRSGACTSVHGGGAVDLNPARWQLCGDFDVRVNFNLLDFTVPVGGTQTRNTGIRASDPSGSDGIAIERYNQPVANPCPPSTQIYKAWTTDSTDCLGVPRTRPCPRSQPRTRQERSA